ncbi:transporter substrate-binding domain-containing protein [Rhizobium sp. KVB221]|uniref:Transporter substrate-binding domain-containing protein n=1 Tax=Rhizobium setariae TaxID=2801340 RepID=A0A937CNN1_9HYPH|nr:transporter substrate-binding domain-containing protein [Rhizobium setariae]MBL0373941.1 transporter substrate-binding domain-containing protein [Rhizobium setariae]
MNRLLTLAFTACMSLAALTAAHAEPLKIGMAPEPYAPFEWKEADGTWKGFEIDLGKAICADIKRECVIVEIAWDGLIPALQTKKIDVIINSMTITEERKKVIDFSDPYYSTVPAFIGPKGTEVELTKEWMSGKSIGVQIATTQAAYIEKVYGDVAEIRTYATQDEANADLVAGRVDLVIADKAPLAEFLKTDAAKDLGMLADVTDGGLVTAGAGVNKDNKELLAQLNTSIAKLLKSGEYDKLAKPYFDYDIYGLPRK